MQGVSELGRFKKAGRERGGRFFLGGGGADFSWGGGGRVAKSSLWGEYLWEGLERNERGKCSKQH